MDNVRLELFHRLKHPATRHTHGQGVHARHHDRGHSHDRKTKVIRDFFLIFPSTRGDDHCLYPRLLEVLQHSQNRVGYAIDIG